MLNHVGTIIIETERLILRRFTLDDAKDMYNNWASDDEVTKYVTWSTHESVDTSTVIISNYILDYTEDDFYEWAIELKETKEVIGSICLHDIDNDFMRCEIGYIISRKHWYKGIAKEAGEQLINLAFNKIGFVRVSGLHDLDNISSGKVLKKLGMTHEGTLRKYSKDNKGNFVDMEIYSIVKC